MVRQKEKLRLYKLEYWRDYDKPKKTEGGQTNIYKDTEKLRLEYLRDYDEKNGKTEGEETHKEAFRKSAKIALFFRCQNWSNFKIL